MDELIFTVVAFKCVLNAYCVCHKCVFDCLESFHLQLELIVSSFSTLYCAVVHCLILTSLS